MVTVPTVKGASVAPQPIDTPFQTGRGASAGSFGAGAAGALAQSGAQLGQSADRLHQIAMTEQIEDNEREAKRLDLEYSSALSALGHGDGTANNPGFYGLSGEAAVGASGSVLDQITKTRQKIENGIKNARVKELFGASAAARAAAEIEAVAIHTTKQRRVASDAVSDARIKEAGDTAADNWNNPRKLAQSEMIVAGEIASQAERNGWSPEVAASKQQEAVTVLYQNAIMAAVRDDPDGANALYVQNRSKIDGRLRPELEATLESVTLATRSQKVADQALAMFGSDRMAARAWIKEQSHGKLRDAAIQRIDEEAAALNSEVNLAYTQERRARARVEDARQDQAYEAQQAKLLVPGLAIQARDQIVTSSTSEREALAAVEKINDPALQEETRRVTKEWYTDKKRSDEEAAAARGLTTAREALKAAGGDEAKAAEALYNLDDPLLQKDALMAFNNITAREDRAKKETEATAVSHAFAYISEGKTVAEFQREFPDEFRHIVATDKLSDLQTQENSYAKGKINLSVTDGHTLDDLLSRDDLSTLDINQVKHRLTPEEVTTLRGYVRSAQDRDRAAEKDTAIYNFGEGALRDAAPAELQKAWAGGKASNVQLRQKQAAINAMNNFIASTFRDSGKNPTPEEINKFAAQSMLKVVSNPPGMFNSTRGIAAEIPRMTPEQKANVTVDFESIPPEEVEFIRAFGRKEGGRELSEEEISALAGARLTGDRARIARILRGE